MKMHFDMLSAKWCEFCPGEDEIRLWKMFFILFRDLNLLCMFTGEYTDITHDDAPGMFSSYSGFNSLAPERN